MKKTATPATKTLGRPPKNIKFPKGDFTVNTVFNRLARYPKAKISKVALTKKLRKMEAEGAAAEVGKRQGKTGRGRPEFIFTVDPTRIKAVKTAAAKTAVVA